MAAPRHLPAKHNPMLTEDVPPYADLVARRRLGQTQLTAKMVAAGAAGDVDPSSLGVFDYAHLRAPLPKGITSGIFKSSPNSYFLMRRSADGYVSATGMFKATFPYAEASEEETERKYIKSLPTTSPDETAGNVWIPPQQALALAEEYKIGPWISALLDADEIAVTNANETSPKKIIAPPKFELPSSEPASPPASISRSTRARRSASPSKKRVIASPRKRSSKATAQAVVDVPTPVIESAGELATPAPSTAADDILIETIEKEPAVVLAPMEEEPKVQVKVDQDVKIFRGVETTHTAIEIDLPVSGQPSAEDARKMIEEAKAMVAAAAAEAAASSGSSVKSKRKAEDISTAPEEEGAQEPTGEAEPRSKKVKTEVQLRKERVRNRALVGLSATLAIGALIPYVMGVF
ncbi:transcription regulator HTH, apses-type DNA-binding domain-containing protein [Microdochium bolleyi]|uniref:Transcription regulator HTH, apses-type DNA-binding domain-containing protein n=1 Tax=Microdochium bolleyi TaxID=196109 RepID=A0A136JDB6_9PEZI|nr:transcription regulator HTH, apses-type DNA-binding domain-containing protein [Microdochium bolleyi]